jgi:hypothetical protein
MSQYMVILLPIPFTADFIERNSWTASDDKLVIKQEQKNTFLSLSMNWTAFEDKRRQATQVKTRY